MEPARRLCPQDFIQAELHRHFLSSACSHNRAFPRASRRADPHGPQFQLRGRGRRLVSNLGRRPHPQLPHGRMIALPGARHRLLLCSISKSRHSSPASAVFALPRARLPLATCRRTAQLRASMEPPTAGTSRRPNRRVEATRQQVAVSRSILLSVRRMATGSTDTHFRSKKCASKNRIPLNPAILHAVSKKKSMGGPGQIFRNACWSFANGC